MAYAHRGLVGRALHQSVLDASGVSERRHRCLCKRVPLVCTRVSHGIRATTAARWWRDNGLLPYRSSGDADSKGAIRPVMGSERCAPER